MKVLFIHDDCQTLGGANTYRRRLCQMIEALGHEIYLFTMEPHPNESEPSYNYTSRRNNVLAHHFKSHYLNPPLFFALRRVIQEVGPNIIHIHSNNLFPNSVLLACGGIPVVQTLHDWKMICPIWNGVTVNGTICERGFGAACHKEGCISRWRYLSQSVWRKFNLFLIKTRVDALIAPSLALSRALKNYGLESIHIPHYADTSRNVPLPSCSDDKRLLCASHLHSSKGVDHLIRAFQNVLMKTPSARLDIVGDGPEKKALEDLCVSLKIQNSVRFRGAVSHSVLANFYAKACVVILPSVVAETGPLVALEAMAAARPVIGSRIGGIPELVVENETGLLFKPRDSNELSAKIIQLLSDPKKTVTMGTLGRKRVEKEYSAEKHVNAILHIYYKLTKITNFEND